MVKAAAEGVLNSLHPKRLYLIHVDNWFDHKWLGFSGQSAGAIGNWKKGDRLTMPPFVPNRVLSQQSWDLDPADRSFHASNAADIHVQADSATNLQRRVAQVAPEAAILWYSGNTITNQRGAIMAYLPEDEDYKTWYVGLASGEEWEVANAKGINQKEFQALMDHSSSRGNA